jgi:hypothetical protein
VAEAFDPARNRQVRGEFIEEAQKALHQIPSMMQTVGRCLERQRRCRPGSKRYLELDAIITKYNGDVSHASSQVWMALQYSKPVQPDLGKCHFCGGKIVSGEDAHHGYTGWPYCEQCHAV